MGFFQDLFGSKKNIMEEELEPVRQRRKSGKLAKGTVDKLKNVI